jgi:hypothetical protein
MEAFVTFLALSPFDLPIANNHPLPPPKQHNKQDEHKPIYSAVLSAHRISPLGPWTQVTVLFSELVKHFSQTAESTIAQKDPSAFNLSSVLHYS